MLLPGGVQHLLLNFRTVGTPAHEEYLRFKGRLGTVGVILVLVIEDAVSAVLGLAVLLVEVGQVVLESLVSLSNLTLQISNKPRRIENGTFGLI